MDSLVDLETESKEQTDVLEALRRSRLEAGRDTDSPVRGPSRNPSQQSAARLQEVSGPKDQDGVWLGQGSVPTIAYPELRRPKPPPLPQRPAIPANRRSETDVARQQQTARSGATPSGTSNVLPALPVPSPHQVSRSPSPEKKTGLRTTLRKNKNGDRPARPASAVTGRNDTRPAAARAATQAWGSLTRSKGAQLGQSLTENGSTASVNSLRRHVDGAVPLSRRAANSGHALEDLEPLLTEPSRDASDRLRPVASAPIVRRRSEDQGHRNQASTADGPPSSTYAWQDYRNRVETDRPSVTKPPSAMVPPPQSNPPPTWPSRPRSSPERADRGSPSTGAAGDCPAANTSTPRVNRTGPARERSGVKLSRTGAVTSRAHVQTTPPQVEDRGRERERGVTTRERVTSDGHRSGSPEQTSARDLSPTSRAREERVADVMKHLPRGVDEGAAKQIFNEIVVQGDEVHWDDVAGLEVAKNALKEAVVYPFLRPDLFMGLREPARGMLLFGPPGTGKTMLARAVATESRSTFFSISASSLTSKYLGESEKLVRALFGLAKALAPSIIFVDEIDSLLSARAGSSGGGGGGGSEHEATRRIKTEFLIQWSDLARAAAGREPSEREKKAAAGGAVGVAGGGDPTRVLVLAATNLPWAIDEAARRRFVRRQYIPLPEGVVRARQLGTLLSHQKHGLTEEDLESLVDLTEGFSGSDITALAKDAAMGPLRQLGEALLHMSPDDIRPIQLADFKASLNTIRPSVSKKGLQQFEDWATEFGERGG